MADFEKIAEVVCAASQATIPFPTISATYRDLELSIAGRVTTAAVTLTNLLLQVNGDTGANYDGTRWNRFGSVVSRGTTSLIVGQIAAATNVANLATSLTIFIPNYRATVFQKTFTSLNATKEGVSADGEITGLQAIGGFWRNTAAISSILLSIASGNFVDGSVATLYGKK
jgi:hypothetical protein